MTSGRPRHRLRRASVRPPYQRVIWSSFVSNTGTEFYRMTAALVAFRLTGQVGAAGAAYLFSLLPRLVLLQIGGVLGDRFDRRGLLIRLDLISALAAALMVLVTSASWLPLLYACGVVLSSLQCLYRPAQQAYLRQLAGEDQVRHAITDFTLAISGAQFAGPLIATPLVLFAGPTTGFVTNAASFLLSAVLLARLPAAGHTRDAAAGIARLLGGYVEILRIYPRVGAIVIGSIAPCIPLTYFMGSAVVYARHLGQPSTFLTVLLGAMAAGGIIGGLWAKHGQTHGYLTGTLAGALMFVEIPAWALLPRIGAAGLALGMIIAIQVLDSVSEIALDVLAQRAVPDDLQGRLVALIFWAFAVGQVIGAFIVTQVRTSQAVGALVPVALGSLIPLVLAACLWGVAPQRSRNSADYGPHRGARAPAAPASQPAHPE